MLELAPLVTTYNISTDWLMDLTTEGSLILRKMQLTTTDEQTQRFGHLNVVSVASVIGVTKASTASSLMSLNVVVTLRVTLARISMTQNDAMGSGSDLT